MYGQYSRHMLIVQNADMITAAEDDLIIKVGVQGEEKNNILQTSDLSS